MRIRRARRPVFVWAKVAGGGWVVWTSAKFRPSPPAPAETFPPNRLAEMVARIGMNDRSAKKERPPPFPPARFVKKSVFVKAPGAVPKPDWASHRSKMARDSWVA